MALVQYCIGLLIYIHFHVISCYLDKLSKLDFLTSQMRLFISNELFSPGLILWNFKNKLHQERHPSLVVLFFSKEVVSYDGKYPSSSYRLRPKTCNKHHNPDRATLK